MRWSTELWDGFDQLTDYFHDGIEFYEKYEKFLKERCVIENTYARSIRKLVKNYEQINQKKLFKAAVDTSSTAVDDINKLTYLKSFMCTLNELKDVAGQHELIAENMQKKIIEKLTILIKSFKEDRRKCIEDRDKYYTLHQTSEEQLRKAKSKYESAFKEAEKAKEILNRVEQDDSASRNDIRKQQTNYQQKLNICDTYKADYGKNLCDANNTKKKFYDEQLPSVINSLQILEEKRINSFREFLRDSIGVETEVIPRIERCYKEMQDATNLISIENDIDTVVQLYKTGYKIPDDHVFEDLGEPSVPSSSSTTLNSNGNISVDNHSLSNGGTIKSVNSLTSSNGNGKINRNEKYKTLNPFKKILKSKNEMESLYDLAPQQQKKELQKKIDGIKADMLKEQKEREGLLKLKDIYTSNQKFGDSQSALIALKQNEEKLISLKQQLQRYEDLYQEVELNGGISKTSATLGRRQTTNATLTTSSAGSKMMIRSNSQLSVDSTNSTNVNNSIPSTPISQHSNQNNLNLTNLSSTINTPVGSAQAATPTNKSKYSENESFDDDDYDVDGDIVNRQVIVNGGKNGGASLSLKQTTAIISDHYEHIDSPPLTANSLTSPATLTTTTTTVTTTEYQQPNEYELESDTIIGRALVIYEFNGNVQNSISIAENETVNVLEKDSGDGWTLVKRINGIDKGYVPTDYIRIEYF